MQAWEWLVVAGGLVAAFWRQAQGFIAWARSWVIVTRKADWSTGLLLLSYMEATMRRSPARDAGYGSTVAFVRPLERLYRVIYQALSASSQRFWHGRRPIWYSSESTNTNENTPGRRDYFMRFSYVRGTVAWEKLLLAAAAWEDESKQGHGKAVSRFRVTHHYGTSWTAEMMQGRDGHITKALAANDSPSAREIGAFGGLRLLQWSMDDVQGETVISTIEHLSLRPELTALVDELKFWHRSQQWYQQHGIPWRRGCLLHGKPGTGKTSFTRAIAEMLDVPVHVFDLSSMSNQDLRRAWREMLTSSPCIALLEDLDAVFEGRENVSKGGAMSGGGLTFDCLLNCIDGIERVDGMLLVVSTNNLDKLDPALVERPGRIDSVVEFHPLDYEGRVKLATRILDSVEAAIEVAQQGESDSAAAFQERCFRIALQQRFTAATPPPSTTNGHHKETR